MSRLWVSTNSADQWPVLKSNIVCDSVTSFGGQLEGEEKKTVVVVEAEN